MSTKRKLLIALAVLLLVLGAFFAWIWRGTPAQHTLDELSGKNPVLVEPKVEQIPSVAVAKSIGWAASETPMGAQGLAVSRFAEGLDHPRVMLTLPNGEIIVAEANAPKGNLGGGLVSTIAGYLMKRAGAVGVSPDTLVLLRDADGDGKAEGRFDLRVGDGLESPSGIAWAGGKLYVANHNAVLQFDYALGETTLSGAPKKLMDLPAAGNHWMRNLVLSPDGKDLYVAVGSASNIGERGMALEAGRAAIWQLNLATGRARQFANGMRNTNGLAWNPSSGELWAVVNERDQLGPDLVPDYLTNVPIGAHYGWPWLYWKTFDDDRVIAAAPDYLDDYVRKPEYALGSHVAPLGLVFATGGHRLGDAYANGAFIARHGSWNRHPLSGYDVVFVKFDANGNPLGLPLPVLTGFLNGKGDTRGRPTWLAFDKGGALLVTDDTAGIVWRVLAPGAAQSAPPRPVVVAPMQPLREISADRTARTSASFKRDQP